MSLSEITFKPVIFLKNLLISLATLNAIFALNKQVFILKNPGSMVNLSKRPKKKKKALRFSAGF